MIAVTGATGKLGQLVINELLKTMDPKKVIAIVRNPSKADALKHSGVQVRQGDYENLDSLKAAFLGVTQVLLISSSEVGKRFAQHKNAIDAAKAAGVRRVVYTSILKADVSRLGLATEHLQTEKYLKSSGLEFNILRNGWYLENHTENLGAALEHGVILGAAGEGKFSSASRLDFAQAAVAVLTQSDSGKIYELGGSQSFTLSELAAAVSRMSNRSVVYKNLPEAEFEKALLGFGLPAPFANLLADSDTGASLGDLYTSSTDLEKLIGRKTTSLETALSKVK